MFPPREIETSRLWLRPPRMADARPIFEKYARDDRVTRYLTWQPHESVEQTRTFLDGAIQAWHDGRGHRSWVVLRRPAAGEADEPGDGELLGMVGADLDEHGVLLGYVLAHRYWGNGYGTEAVDAVCERALADDDVYRVWAYCDVANTASRRLLEKIGMEREGTLRRFAPSPNRGRPAVDCDVYSRVD